ncbi:hypothetical protein [Paenibacillus sp. FSL R10-2771]
MPSNMYPKSTLSFNQNRQQRSSGSLNPLLAVGYSTANQLL